MKQSAGILPFRIKNGELEVFLAHFGGPFWKKKKRSWGIVKGELEQGEEPLEAAKREFYEETGKKIVGEFIDLGEVKSSGKINRVFAVQTDLDTKIRSNTFMLEWPPKSGKMARFPEIDRAMWFALDDAKEVIVASQIPFLERLAKLYSKDI